MDCYFCVRCCFGGFFGNGFISGCFGFFFSVFFGVFYFFEEDGYDDSDINYGDEICKVSCSCIEIMLSVGVVCNGY